MNTGYKDGVGNDIIIGHEYCVPVHGTSQYNNTKMFGIAIKVMEPGKRGTKITLQLTRIETYAYGELNTNSFYHPITSFEHLQENPQVGSYYPTFMFPTGKTKADYGVE